MKKKLLIIGVLSLTIIISWCTKIESNKLNVEINNTVPNQASWKVDNMDNTDTETNNITKNTEINNETDTNENIETINEPTESIAKNESEKTTETELDDADKIINKLNEYAQWGEFDEEWVDLLYEVIDTLSK